ncbi:hypothetical protein SKAU_G00015380 [Synaphobranchus kaupii]|uniref:Uncharacterized protein n=1 Tax=Synaphobranchus kaupii TaxID=118154 RepID=A0A9Q1JDC8_SYNKA|nr:hypothetical protein SKAU_G00015380 [Synaphobranchus kaupii]
MAGLADLQLEILKAELELGRPEAEPLFLVHSCVVWARSRGWHFTGVTRSRRRAKAITFQRIRRFLSRARQISAEETDTITALRQGSRPVCDPPSQTHAGENARLAKCLSVLRAVIRPHIRLTLI